jgi:hypothetical protein
MEFIGTIWQSAPHQRGDRVDHHPKFVFGVLHFRTAFLELHYLMAPLEDIGAISFQGRGWNDSGGASGLLYEPSSPICNGNAVLLMGSPLEAQILPRSNASFKSFT